MYNIYIRRQDVTTLPLPTYTDPADMFHTTIAYTRCTHKNECELNNVTEHARSRSNDEAKLFGLTFSLVTVLSV